MIPRLFSVAPYLDFWVQVQLPVSCFLCMYFLVAIYTRFSMGTTSTVYRTTQNLRTYVLLLASNV
jgi:hypothetical protein